MRIKKQYLLTAILITLVVGFPFMTNSGLWKCAPEVTNGSDIGRKGTRTHEGIIKIIAPKYRDKLKKMFADAGSDYPPKKLTMLALKDEGDLEVWARDKKGEWAYIATYLITAASGGAGPKLKRGDYQIPEGIYSILWHNPNSSYHLSMKLNYPNKFDKEMAKRDKRARLGGDIFIHGKAASIGCIAMGDAPIEELYLMVHDIGKRNTKVIVMPYDFRVHDEPPKKSSKPDRLKYFSFIDSGEIVWKQKPEWLPELYKELKVESKKYIRKKKL